MDNFKETTDALDTLAKADKNVVVKQSILQQANMLVGEDAVTDLTIQVSGKSLYVEADMADDTTVSALIMRYPTKDKAEVGEILSGLARHAADPNESDD